MGLTTEVKMESTTEGKRSKLISALKNKGKFLPMLNTLMGKDASSGWFPFTGDVANPETGEPFNPATKPYTTLEKHSWGGVAGNYSDRYIFACDLVFQQMITFIWWAGGASIIKAEHQWKEIAVVTNGLC